MPDAIREQANWTGLLNDPEWGSPVQSGERLCKIPFIDITDDYYSFESTPWSGYDFQRLRDDACVCHGTLLRMIKGNAMSHIEWQAPRGSRPPLVASSSSATALNGNLQKYL